MWLVTLKVRFQPLEWRCNGERPTDACFLKLICEKEGEKVIGAHVIGPNAGEMVQGKERDIMVTAIFPLN